jgi:diguanylate cyclase (GGDEF)-like protein
VTAVVIAMIGVVAIIALVVARVERSSAQANKMALRLALAREVVFIECARRLADAAARSLEAVRDEIVRTVRAIAPTIDGLVFFEEHEAQLRCVYAVGERTEYASEICIALDDPQSLVVRALARSHRVTLRSEPGARALHPGDTYAAAIPLALEAGRTCVLTIGARSAVPDEMLDRIVAIVDQATPAYRIAREREDDRARSEFDALTGLLSPRSFRERLTALVERSRLVPRARLAVLFIDTDKFKAWNDTFGHASGDALLRELARMLRAAACEPGDIAARNGGDEFCLVFADAEKSHALERAHALCAAIASADFSALQPKDAQGAVAISASIGVAAFPVDAVDPSDLLERADAAMYHSKRTGRNAVSYLSPQGEFVRLGSAAAASS